MDMDMDMDMDMEGGVSDCAALALCRGPWK
jgi:hypothetical protein